MKSIIYFLRFSLKKYKKYFLKAFLLAIISVVLLLPLPLITKSLFDKILEKNILKIKQFSVLILFVIVSVPLIDLVKEWFFQKFRLLVERDLRMELMKNYLKQEWEFFTKYESGYLIGRMNEVDWLRGLMADSLFSLSYNLFALVVSAFALFILNYKIAIIIITLLPIYSYTILHFGRKVRDKSYKAQEVHSKMQEKAQEILSGIETVKTFPSTEPVEKMFKDKLDNLFFVETNLVKLNIAVSNLPKFIMSIGIGYFLSREQWKY